VTATPRQVLITEVGPRDGLQNERRPVPTEAKVLFVRALVAAGISDVEVSSFVRPDLVPQLADAEEVFRALGPAPKGVTYGALVPNAKGLERALAVGVGKVAVFTAASETFNRRNVNASIAESIERFRPVVQGARQAMVAVRGYVSTAVWCPYEGPIAPAAVLGVVERLLDLGCDEISVGDTIGAGTPGHVARLLDALLPAVPADRLVLHFHDTRGMAVANVAEGLRHGVSRYDASAGGLGGCPFAPGAAGNLATEDLVFLLDGLGVRHGVHLGRLRAASALLAGHVDHPLPGRSYGAPPLEPKGSS
jgi:isopropylmalate/homocitrate/citramalate synthase